MGKLKTYNPTYCIMDKGENMLNLTHTLDKIYLTGIVVMFCNDFPENWTWELEQCPVHPSSVVGSSKVDGLLTIYWTYMDSTPQ